MDKQALGAWQRVAISRSDLKGAACSLLLGIIGVALMGFSQRASAEDRPIVNVSTVEQLYAAVNDPANADTLIVLAPGIYTLSSTAPNEGSLVLQPHMGLAGYNEYRDVDGDGVWDEVDWPARDGFPATRAFARPKTETVIDGTQLTLNSGVIRIGYLDGQQQADNSVGDLTVRGGLPAGTGTAGAEVGARALPLGSSIHVTDCLLEKGQRGIRLASALNDATSHLVAERNILRDHDLTPHTLASSRGWGIHLDPEALNGIALSNVSLTAQVRFNRFYNNRIGLYMVQLGTEDSDNNVVSQSNIYDSQVQSAGGFTGIGTGIFAYINSSLANTQRSRNKLISINDTIVNNVGNGGVFAFFQAPNSNMLQDNAIDLSLVGTVFVKLNAAGKLDGYQNRTSLGKRADVSLLDLAPGGTPGANVGDNRLTVLLRHTFTSFKPIPTDSNPMPLVITDRADVTPDQVSLRVIGKLETADPLGGRIRPQWRDPSPDFTGNGPE